jgi:O-antigen ligase
MPRPPWLATLLIWGLVLFTIVPSTIFSPYKAVEVNPAALEEGMPVVYDDAMPTQGTVASQAIWLMLLTVGGGLVIYRSGTALKLLRQVNPFLLVFYALVACSLLWSIEPGITLKRLFTSSTVAIVSMGFAVSRYDFQSFQRVLRPVLTAILLGSILYVLVMPEKGIEQSLQTELIGAWRGLTFQKNSLGGISAITLILWLHALLSGETRKVTALLGVFVAGLCLVNSRSSTSIMASLFAGVLLLLMLRSPGSLRRYLPYVIGLFVGALLVYSLAVLKLVPGSDLLLSPITALTGKDQTFSGRTAIWGIISEHIALHPLLGTGYGAYWVQIPTSPSMEMLQRLYFYPTEGHNGYLDVINDLGYVGALCLVSYLVTYLRQGLRILLRLRPQGALYLTVLFLQMIGNLSESRWFNVLDFNFVVVTLATVCMGRTLMDLKGSPQIEHARSPLPALRRRAAAR